MNSVLFHPSLLHIVTAGIERHVILHSPTKSSPCAKDLTFTPTSVRGLPAGSPEDHNRYLRAVSSNLVTNDLDEDAETIALFDECVCVLSDRGSGGDLTTTCRILRTEGEGRDIFSGRGCDESEDEDEDVSDGESDTQWY